MYGYLAQLAEQQRQPDAIGQALIGIGQAAGGIAEQQRAHQDRQLALEDRLRGIAQKKLTFVQQQGQAAALNKDDAGAARWANQVPGLAKEAYGIDMPGGGVAGAPVFARGVEAVPTEVLGPPMKAGAAMPRVGVPMPTPYTYDTGRRDFSNPQSQAAVRGLLGMEPAKPIEVSQGATLYDPQARKPLYTAPYAENPYKVTAEDTIARWMKDRELRDLLNRRNNETRLTVNVNSEEGRDRRFTAGEEGKDRRQTAGFANREKLAQMGFDFKRWQTDAKYADDMMKRGQVAAMILKKEFPWINVGHVGRRSLAEQTALWEGSGRNPKFAAPPGTSLHGVGASIDFGHAKVINPEELARFQARAEQLGLVPYDESASPNGAHQHTTILNPPDLATLRGLLKGAGAAKPPKLVTDISGKRVKDVEGVQVRPEAGAMTWAQMSAQADRQARGNVALKYRGQMVPPDPAMIEAEVMEEKLRILDELQQHQPGAVAPVDPAAALMEEMRAEREAKKGGKK